MIYILSGPIRSGKTSALLDWASQADVEGVLTPDGLGSRYFKDLTTKTTYHMEAVGTEYSIAVGKFKFSKDSFEKAEKSLLQTPMSKYKVIDEIGKLEVKGEGFHDVLVEILEHQLYREHLVLVVREELLQVAQEKFGLVDAEVISKEDLLQLV